jgi:polysaccharide biosynthesis protein PslH
MKILFVSTSVPVPPNNGQAIRSLSILRALGANGHSVTFVSFSNKQCEKETSPLSNYCAEVALVRKEVTSLSLNSDYITRARCLLRRRAYSVERYTSTQMQNRISDELRTKRFDLILCDGMYALVNVPATDVPILMNCHNIEHIIYRRYSQVETNVVKKSYARIESHLMLRAELRSMDRVAKAMVCSNVDRVMLQELCPRLKICIVPNTVDTEFLAPQEAPNGDHRHVLLFQGGMDWYPNRDAVIFFTREVLPKVQREFPDIRFVVAGRNPPPNFVASFSDVNTLEFTGTVPDMRPYLSQATVVVVPLRIGGGTRIKILEACASGKPVVSTVIGAEGLDLTPDHEILLADKPDLFADKVIGLLKDRRQREELVRSARRVVVEKYSHHALNKGLQDAVSNFERS